MLKYSEGPGAEYYWGLDNGEFDEGVSSNNIRCRLLVYSIFLSLLTRCSLKSATWYDRNPASTQEKMSSYTHSGNA